MKTDTEVKILQESRMTLPEEWGIIEDQHTEILVDLR
jgi:hypothetical protein